MKGSVLINGPVPDEDTLEWDSSDILSDEVPFREQNSNKLWWAIAIDNSPSKDLFDEIKKWCENNCQYQCELAYKEKSWSNEEDYILGRFRHPDDAFAFKLAWS